MKSEISEIFQRLKLVSFVRLLIKPDLSVPRLLLPYEYHLAGYGDEVPITLPRQRKRFHPDDEYNQGPKRADFTSLHQYNQVHTLFVL